MVKQARLDKLHSRIAEGAMHNSGERFDPPRCYPGTREAILKRLFDWFLDNDRDGFMSWLFGPAGAGKSAVMQEIAERLYERGLLIASFFFSRTSALRNDEKCLVPTIAYQLAIAIPSTRPYIEQAIESNLAVLSSSLENQLQKLVIEPLNHVIVAHQGKSRLAPTAILIDGLDECASGAVQQRILTCLSIVPTRCQFPLLFLIASRPEQHIVTTITSSPFQFGLTQTVLETNSRAEADIRLFLTEKFKDIKRTHTFRAYIPRKWPSTDIVEALVRKSSGQFVVASTIARYISHPDFHPHRRLDIVLKITPRLPAQDSPFSELDALYFHLFSSLHPETQETALQILGLLIFPYKDAAKIWTTREVEEFLDLEHDSAVQALSTLASVVSVSHRMKNIRILHASLADFLLDKDRSGRFHIDLPTMSNYFARMCLFSFQFGTYTFKHAVQSLGEYCTNAMDTEDLRLAFGKFDFMAISERSPEVEYFLDNDFVLHVIDSYLEGSQKLKASPFIETRYCLYMLPIRISEYFRSCKNILEVPMSATTASTSSISFLPPFEPYDSRSAGHPCLSLSLRSGSKFWGTRRFLPFVEQFLTSDDFTQAAGHVAFYIASVEETWSKVTESDHHRLGDKLCMWRRKHHGCSGSTCPCKAASSGEEDQDEHSKDCDILILKHQAYEYALRILPFLLRKATPDEHLTHLLSSRIVIPEIWTWKSEQSLITFEAFPESYQEFISKRELYDPLQGHLTKLLSFAEDSIADYFKRALLQPTAWPKDDPKPHLHFTTHKPSANSLVLKAQSAKHLRFFTLATMIGVLAFLMLK
ncbi:hypothetical protein NLJ89_g1660 [Agrocybe chaxingu]|uniref:Nephrocystin 3-like N-terminal domain-containing protein n=1 Tax=Agrocybe chaxingu TaxID=84603 RepID=A0A9W8TE02_9AGAR|nr:hypothetical protein NLJ89_g1660 [Agrocybe chaxingu]